VANDDAWARTPVDRFIWARLKKAGLEPLPAADRATLVRRLSFDLTGLPPKPDEIDAFVADSSPQAYETLVDRLLASPAYGERFAQHWLDLARFAETDGFEHDYVRANAWKYRDWVIDALNRDLPYDEFVRLQVAGDLLHPNDQSAAIATGFLLCGPDMPDLNLPEERRHVVLNEMTAAVGSALLGLQLGCAECHDHKYDPISQADFYRLRACFETAELFKHPKFGRVVQEKPAANAMSRIMLRGDFRRPGPVIAAAFPRIANPRLSTVQEVSSSKPISPRLALAHWLTEPDNPLATRVIANRLWQHHFGEGLVRTPSDFGLMGETPSHPELLDWLASELTQRGWSLKQMHRLLVTSAVYRQASRPAAATWTEEQRRAATQRWQRSKEADPSNRLLSHANRRRLEGEAIRDAMLSAADRLSERRGGAGVKPPLPSELLATLLKKQWEPSLDEEDHRRRSVYLFVRRNLRYPLFEVFDRPDTNASCPQRHRSTTAPQALWQFNSEFSLTAAEDLARFVIDHADDQAADHTQERIELVYRRILGRKPTEEESAEAAQFLASTAFHADDGQDRDNSGDQAALTALCLAMFNLNEFIYVD
jgi:hypothetical protein